MTESKLVTDALALLEPLEWFADMGRECSWCGATRHTFKKDSSPRDNHRDGCRWLSFYKDAKAFLSPLQLKAPQPRPLNMGCCTVIGLINETLIYCGEDASLEAGGSVPDSGGFVFCVKHHTKVKLIGGTADEHCSGLKCEKAQADGKWCVRAKGHDGPCNDKGSIQSVHGGLL